MRRVVPLGEEEVVLGLGVTLAVVSAFAWFALHEMEVLRQLQTGLMERSRRDSLQLVYTHPVNRLGTLSAALLKLWIA